MKEINENPLVNINASEVMAKCRSREDMYNFCRELGKIFL